jgi:DNA replication and repair protein RecF
MSIENLNLTNFRNIEDVSITLHPKLNVVYGPNASGKTSLLEAFYFISTGRSFRSRRIENIIKRHNSATEFILFGKLKDKNSTYSAHNVGIKKSTILPTQIRLNKEPIKSASQLAKLSPIILIDPLSFDLLNGAPTQRRQFLDWGVFHVEPLFSMHWNNYINCLKQRNSLLRNAKIDQILLKVWDSKLAELGELIHHERKTYFDKFQKRLTNYLTFFSLSENIKVSYYKGWDKSKQLNEALVQFKDRDIERKFTQAGPHRADIKVSIYGQAASESLSRGQQKLFVFAMYLAQMQTLFDVFEKNTVVLIDDVTAELDDKNLELVFNKLLALDAQVIVTVLNNLLLDRLQRDNTAFKMFHVEHGNITVIE